MNKDPGQITMPGWTVRPPGFHAIDDSDFRGVSNPPSKSLRLCNPSGGENIPLTQTTSTCYGVFLIQYKNSRDLYCPTNCDVIYQNCDQDGRWRFAISGARFNSDLDIISITPISSTNSTPFIEGIEITNKLNESTEEEKHPCKHPREE